MPATCVPRYVPRAKTGLSKHGDPVFPHFWSWNQNLARVCAKGGGVHSRPTQATGGPHPEAKEETGVDRRLPEWRNTDVPPRTT